MSNLTVNICRIKPTALEARVNVIISFSLVSQPAHIQEDFNRVSFPRALTSSVSTRPGGANSTWRTRQKNEWNLFLNGMFVFFFSWKARRSSTGPAVTGTEVTREDTSVLGARFTLALPWWHGMLIRTRTLWAREKCKQAFSWDLKQTFDQWWAPFASGFFFYEFEEKWWEVMSADMIGESPKCSFAFCVLCWKWEWYKIIRFRDILGIARVAERQSRRALARRG